MALILGLGKIGGGHLLVDLVHALVELAHPVERREHPRENGVAREAHVPDVVHGHDIGELSRALDEHAIVVDVDADVFPADAVAAVRDGVHEALEPGVLGVLRHGPELHRPVDLELKLPQLG